MADWLMVLKSIVHTCPPIGVSATSRTVGPKDSQIPKCTPGVETPMLELEPAAVMQLCAGLVARGGDTTSLPFLNSAHSTAEVD